MSAQFMRRNIRISVRLTEEEHRLLKEKMARIGVTNQEAFLRKMALDGLVIRLDLPELKQMISLLRYTSNNINQIAKRLNESGRAYDTDLAEILERQKQLWGLSSSAPTPTKSTFTTTSTGTPLRWTVRKSSRTSSGATALSAGCPT